MKNYTYVVMENSQQFSWGEYAGGSISPVAAFPSKEEAEAVAVLRQRSAERHPVKGMEVPEYYVVRVVSYS